MNPSTAHEPRPEARRGSAGSPGELESRHAALGMPVVAAAARYPSEARNPACKPPAFASREPEDAVD
ncbi:MAG TPA: hypothetical protein VFQ27_12650 [Xanthobacteraceae bacterium]|nr:hypothetical protein [Xanthobacteraceae bacterium]